MPLLLLKNAKYLLYALAFASGFYIKGEFAENKLTRELAKQESEFNQKLAEREAREKEASDAYQKKLAAISGSASKLRKLYSDRCYTVSKATSGPDGSTATNKLSREYTITPRELIDIGEDAEKVRLQLIALQDFINGN